MDSKTKIKAFFENTKRLNKRFGITPLLYGSLGLEYVTGEDFSADDIDILIPEYYITDGWRNFRRFLETIGYVLTDEHEHTFEKDGISFSYASIENLSPFAGIELSDIETVKRGDISFLILSPEQYLAVYKASAKDGYRLNVKEKKDNEKIERINAFLSKKDKEKTSKKKFKIKNFCKMNPVVTVAIALLFLFVGAVTVLSFLWEGYDLGVCFLIVLFMSFVGLGFFFNYGITVSEKYVTVIYFNGFRIFRYDEVTKIELWVDDDGIIGTVKPRGEKEYDFCFGDFNPDHTSIIFTRLWDVKAKITEKKAKQILADAKAYEKITIHNSVVKRGK